MSALMSQLAAAQKLATTWLSNPPQEVQCSMRAQEPLTSLEMLPFGDQVLSHHNNAKCGEIVHASNGNMQPCDLPVHVSCRAMPVLLINRSPAVPQDANTRTLISVQALACWLVLLAAGRAQ